ncbi:MAG TPA: heme-binding protein [Thermoanaerobaculia bacterium]|nr:heme-binding protein [Thermoanaerobaculia bacterium]
MSRSTRAILSLCLAGLGAGAAFAAPVAPAHTLTTEGGRKVIAAALEYARSHAAPGGAIAVVDAGGAVVVFERLDGTFPAASRVAIGKAQTSAWFKKPTKVFEDAVNGGRTTMVALPDFTPLQGGVPLVFDGETLGAVGVSGSASAQQDEEIALAGAAVLSADSGR